jgi:hypothetical protein
MLLAKRSGEGAVENQDDVRFSLKIRKVNGLTLIIIQGEIRGWGV